MKQIEGRRPQKNRDENDCGNEEEYLPRNAVFAPGSDCKGEATWRKEV